MVSSAATPGSGGIPVESAPKRRCSKAPGRIWRGGEKSRMRRSRRAASTADTRSRASSTRGLRWARAIRRAHRLTPRNKKYVVFLGVIFHPIKTVDPDCFFILILFKKYSMIDKQKDAHSFIFSFV